MSDSIQIEYPFVAIDVETTGLNPKINEIVEVFAVEFNASGMFGKSYHSMCRPKSGFIPH